MRLIAAATAVSLAVLALGATGVSAQSAVSMPGSQDRARVTAGSYTVDANHTQVTWEVNHLGFTMLQGQFGAKEGTLTLDPANLANAKVDVTFATDQLTSTSPAFTTHLKSADFFDVANHPTARFVSTAVAATARGARITGNLTIKGITKPVTLDATFVGAGASPMNKKNNVGFRATTSFNRSDFGVGRAAPMVSDRVDLVINAGFVAQ